MATLADLEAQYEQKVAEREALNARYQAGEVGVLPQIQALNVEIAALSREISALTYPPASAAAAVADSDDSATQNPSTGPTLVVPESEINQARDIGPAEQSAQVTRDGGQAVADDSASTKTLEQTQSVSSTEGRASPQASGTPGVGAQGEDSGSRQATAQIINASFNGTIKPQPNVLDQYASYTYNIGWYVMAPSAFKLLQETGKKSLQGCQLLVQSGGALSGSTGGQTGPNPTLVGAGRSDYFSLDYYIDNLEIKNYLEGKGTGTAHNLSEIKFTVTEPGGISLMGNLRRAAEAWYVKDGVTNANYVDAIYCLVIRFYGYDSNGNIVQVGRDINSSTAPRAVVEKFYPFQISEVHFKANGGKIDYLVSGKPVGYNIALGSSRNVIPHEVEVSGRTIRDLLVGDVSSANQPGPETDGRESETTSAPESGNQGTGGAPKADAANIAKFSGLAEALNKFQRQQVGKTIDVPDEYEIEFFPKELGDSLVLKEGTPYYNKSPIEDVKTGNQAVDPETQSGNFQSRTATAFAGTTITQFIDQQMRNSQYVTNQSNVYYDEVTGERKTRTPLKQIAWFKINVQVTPKTEKIDTKRGGFAYKIKYLITPYNIVNSGSDYFPDPVYRGSHKSFNYWFTGQNTQILSFEQKFNALYQMVLSDSSELVTTKLATNKRDILKRVYQPFSDQSSQGANLKTNETSANLADSLYSPSDLNMIDLKIIGDPAFLQQGEVTAGISEKNFTFNPFNDDGTINFDCGAVVFDITWNRPQDYDLNTGLMDPTKNNTASSKTTNLEPESATYYGTHVTSTFRNGRFEQLLKGTMLYSDPANSQAAQNGRVPATNLTPTVRTGNGVTELLQASGTTSTAFTNTSQPGLLSPAVASIQSGNNTADGSASAPTPTPQEETEPATSNGAILDTPEISTPVDDAQQQVTGTGGDGTELTGPPKLPGAEDDVDWNNIPSYEIRGTSESLKNQPVADQTPQLMNREF
jgi:hypothetical protein